MKNIAIIPARSGSKRLKNKNIMELNGKPLLAYSIEAAIKSNMFEEIMVSTDSEKYATIASSYGAKIPFLRSKKNSNDNASSWDMVSEVLDYYDTNGYFFDTFCLLQPTSPLREYNDIIKAYDLYKNSKALSVVSVCEIEHYPFLFCNIATDNKLIGFLECSHNNSKFYRLNGAIYIADIITFRQFKNIYNKQVFAYIMKQEKSIDIDNSLDFKIASMLLGGGVRTLLYVIVLKKHYTSIWRYM